ncbi:Rha family transcriptional regulator [Kozakia baliensis]|uniref:Rha family transcriptional regulator n=1 Tax=Kozakia baliensis TaxID=153496 RepID=UPI00056A21F6|nr:Rha family transcriptional regulator [Kozakia baliensis]
MANSLITTSPSIPTMSSREIAKLTGKTHKNVIRDIDAMIADIEKDGSDLIHQAKSMGYVRHTDNRGYTSSIDLSQDLTYNLVLGYDPARRLKVIRRWMELEAKQSAPAPTVEPFRAFDPSNFIALALAEFPNLSPISRQTFIAKVGAAAFGQDLLPLPRVEEHHHSATEVAAKLGVSANVIGRIANANGLKTPKNGIVVMDKSRHSSKQVETFRYNAHGIEALRSAIGQKAS